MVGAATSGLRQRCCRRRISRSAAASIAARLARSAPAGMRSSRPHSSAANSGSERTGNSRNAEIEAVASAGSAAGIRAHPSERRRCHGARIGLTHAPPSPAVQTICCAIWGYPIKGGEPVPRPGGPARPTGASFAVSAGRVAGGSQTPCVDGPALPGGHRGDGCTGCSSRRRNGRHDHRRGQGLTDGSSSRFRHPHRRTCGPLQRAPRPCPPARGAPEPCRSAGLPAGAGEPVDFFSRGCGAS